MKQPQPLEKWKDRYCYLCNRQMGQNWVCSYCVEKYNLNFDTPDKSPELVAFQDFAPRTSPHEPIPEKVVDYVMDYLSDDLRLIVRFAQHRQRLMG